MYAWHLTVVFCVSSWPVHSATTFVMANGNLTGLVDDPCNPGPGLYVQLVGTLLFLLAWPLMLLDSRYLPMGRPAATLVSATLMVIFNIVSHEQVFEVEGCKKNLQSVFMVLGMQLLSYDFDREGLLCMAAQWVFGPRNRPFRCNLWKVCMLSGIMAAFITNDTTVLVLTPLLLREFMHQRRSRKEILPLALGIATSADIAHPLLLETFKT